MLALLGSSDLLGPSGSCLLYSSIRLALVFAHIIHIIRFFLLLSHLPQHTQPDEHQFCCIEPTDKCSLQDGCRYQDTWGATCPAGTQEIKACVMESWFNTREFCCPVDDTSKCNPASRPELRCEYMVGLTDVVCPAGRYEETSCKVTKMGGLYEHEL